MKCKEMIETVVDAVQDTCSYLMASCDGWVTRM